MHSCRFSPKLEPPATINMSWGNIMEKEDEKRRQREERERRRQERPPRNKTNISSASDRYEIRLFLSQKQIGDTAFQTL